MASCVSGEEKTGDPDRMPSERMRSVTVREFFAELNSAMQDCGLTVDEAIQRKSVRRISNVYEPNLYLFPAYIEMLKRGYKRYPDLSA
jgi:hypothetical protein